MLFWGLVLHPQPLKGSILATKKPGTFGRVLLFASLLSSDGGILALSKGCFFFLESSVVELLQLSFGFVKIRTQSCSGSCWYYR